MDIDFDECVIDMLGNEEAFSIDWENYDFDEFLASISSENSSYDCNLKENHVENTENTDRNHSTDDVVLEPNYSMKCFNGQDPLFGSWSGDVSSFDSLEKQLLSEARDQCADADLCSGEENAFASSRFSAEDAELSSLFCMNNSLDIQHSSNTLHGFSKNFEPVDMSEDFLKFSSMDEDDLCQWFDPSPEDSTCRTESALDNTISESMKFDPIPSFGTVNSDGIETSETMHGFENSFFGSMEPDFRTGQGDEIWGNMLIPVVSTASDTGFDDCMSDLDVDTLKGLLSELEIEGLLSGESNYNPFNSSCFDQVVMEDFSPVNRNPMQFTNQAWSEARAELMQPISDLDNTNSLTIKKDALPKSQVGLCLDGSNSIKLGETVLVHREKKEEPKKPVKKKAKPGESTRPRPKDRQRIQDCIQQLRKIIPGKDVKECSIDHLLKCSIDYMVFLQAIAYYENKLQEPEKPKLIEHADGVVLQDSSLGNSKNSDAGQTLACPIIVEDMDHPGQMLIEMLCEEHCFSLELADKIKGLGLNILKANMEIRNTKLWARFIVNKQENGNMTRINVFLSLLHLLQNMNTFGTDSANNHYNVNDANVSGMNRQLPEKNSCRYSWP